MKFTQTISVRCDDPEGLAAILAEWDHDRAAGDLTGYIGNRLLANRDDPGNYLIVAEFASVDGATSSVEEAETNNRREETERWAERLRALVESEPEWVHYDELYRTGLTGNIQTG